MRKFCELHWEEIMTKIPTHVCITNLISVQVYDGEGGLRLHPNDGFTGENTPDVTLSAERGELNVRFITDSAKSSIGFSAVYSADCPTLNTGAGAVSATGLVDTTFGSVVTFTCPAGQIFSTGT